MALMSCANCPIWITDRISRRNNGLCDKCKQKQDRAINKRDAKRIAATQRSGFYCPVCGIAIPRDRKVNKCPKGHRLLCSPTSLPIKRPTVQNAGKGQTSIITAHSAEPITIPWNN